MPIPTPSTTLHPDHDPAPTASQPPEPAELPEPSGPAGYGHSSWRALGTYVQLVVADAARLEAAQAEAIRVLSQVDAACSRFREDSDLVRANRAAGSWVAVHPVLVAAVTAALWAAEETEGLVDPTLGRSLAAVGYDRDLAQVQGDHGPAAIPIPLPAVPDAWREVGVRGDGDQAELFVPAGVCLDLGATGKAFAADLVAGQIVEVVGTDAVISIGGDVAIGSTGTAPTPHQWQIAVGERPDEPPAQTVVLEHGGMATSSTVHRRWTRGGQTAHHLLDPRTGRPVQRTWRTVSVAASSCLIANTASTASIVLGERAADWLGERDLAARLVARDGAVHRVAGWPQEVPDATTTTATGQQGPGGSAG